MTNKKAKLLGRALGGILHGYGQYGLTTKATLFIGRNAGLERGPVPEGKTISKNKVVGTVMGLRTEQIGPSAGGTITATAGYYKGSPEPSVKVDLFFDGSDGSVKKFQKNVIELAERTAKQLAQREIIIEWAIPGKRPITGSATPKGAPSPTSPKFCEWVRKHSKSARENPRDPCYSGPKKRR